MKKYILYLPVLLLSITSCDPGVDFKRYVTNNSDYDLFYVKKGGYDSVDSFIVETDTVRINSASTELVYEYDHIGTVSQFEDCIPNDDSPFYEAFLIVQINDSLTIKVDPNISSSWSFEIIRKFGRSGECECILEINNSDIE